MPRATRAPAGATAAAVMAGLVASPDRRILGDRAGPFPRVRCSIDARDAECGFRTEAAAERDLRAMLTVSLLASYTGRHGEDRRHRGRDAGESRGRPLRRPMQGMRALFRRGAPGWDQSPCLTDTLAGRPSGQHPGRKRR